MDILQLKEEFKKEKTVIFNRIENDRKSFQLCIDYSNLIDNYIYKILGNLEADFLIVASGGYGRRELSPFSDIDLIFIIENNSILVDQEENIKKIITALWDCGIEVSHTIRLLEDIQIIFSEDLHAFTQFFETRLLYGKTKLYDNWNQYVFNLLTEENRKVLVNKFIDDIQLRYKKYGNSPKVLEPNIKYTAGGLRDLQSIEWIYSILNYQIFTNQREITQTESFLIELTEQNIVNKNEINRIYSSYEFLLLVRNILHNISDYKLDRFEFVLQENIASILGYVNVNEFMKDYFQSTIVINRFTKTMLKGFIDQVTIALPQTMLMNIDEDFQIKGKVISLSNEKELKISDIMRAFYYRGIYDARFDDNLRSIIIEMSSKELLENIIHTNSSMFFRQILRMEKNIYKTLNVMNELGVLSIFIPEFKELVGFFQPGVYHCYTADEHTLIAIKNLEELNNSDSRLGYLFSDLLEKDILYIAVLLHDIAKPISISGHEIIGSEIAYTVMDRLGYSEKEISIVQFLVKHHLAMEQVAFRRDINDPSTLNSFTSLFATIKLLDMLLLLTYADLSAVNSMVWTQWKNDQLFELYRHSRAMLLDEISAEKLLFRKTIDVLKGTSDKYAKHLNEMDDLNYVNQFTEEEMLEHAEAIQKGSEFAMFFKETSSYTNITVLSKDSNSLLSRICGVFAINDLNIHDARIFTRKDGIILDSFNVTVFSTNNSSFPDRHKKIENDLKLCLKDELQINREFKKQSNKWWRIENKIFRKKDIIKIRFEEHDKYTIIDVSAPDRLGLLYQITKCMNDLGLNIYFAKISTKGDDVIDSFYTLDRYLKKILPHDYEMIRMAITQTIEEML